MIKRTITILVISTALYACGTIRHHTDNPQPELYGGTKDDLKTLGHVNGPISGILVIIDIPLSIIADTVMGIGSLFSSPEENISTVETSNNEKEKH